MKEFPKYLVISLLLAVFYAAANTLVYGQSTIEECHAIYQSVTDNRVSPDIIKLRVALASSHEYLRKCSELKDQDAIKIYVTGQVPKIEERIKQAEIKLVEERYNKAIQNKNYDDMLSTAKELLRMDRPYSLDLMLDIASLGFDNASAKPAVNKYNDDAVTYAKQAVQAISEGKTSGNFDKVTGKADRYGGYIAYRTEKCPDGKSNATGWMNYTIGYITYVSMKQKTEALPYLYRASQAGCETRENSELYRMIGAWYLDEFLRLDATRMNKIKAAGGTDTEETLALLALERGYSERAMDAYARAYKKAIESKAPSQSYNDALLMKLKEVYGVRYDDDMSKFDTYLKQAGTTAFVDPAIPVTPIVEAPPKVVTAPSPK